MLGEADARLMCAYFDVTEQGNFEHRNILHVREDLDAVAAALGVSTDRLAEGVERGRHRLFEAREARVKPARDEKVLTSWNGLMLRAFAEASVGLGRADYREIAVANAEFVSSNLWRDGRLLRTWRDGRSKLNGYLEDYANYADGLVALYEATFDPRWLRLAVEIADVMLDQFADEDRGGFFDTGKDHEVLVSRPKDLFDNATPGGNSVAADMLSRLALLTGDDRFRRAAESIFDLLGPFAVEHPAAFARLLCALDFHLGEPTEIAIVGNPATEDTRALLRAVFERFRPNKVVAAASPDLAPPGIALLVDRPAVGGRATAYVCRNYVCSAPVTSADELRALLG